ncbi:BatA domain-containing protein [Singulisphaera sp. PoT]|uniref:BatA domain-containing protein n=1 Tax=Singulisphaera sp. PoT TaxID=3411797 RepID=UPI003BF57655
MSFLTPLYILGALAIAAPIIFHLIRRAPQGEVPFSSLMFLSPTPPRLTRRSRLDNILLLILRGLALALLALAFARPFLRQAAQLGSGPVERQRVAILVDTSASMRRGDLWNRAKALAEEAIKGCRPTDQWALFAFDTSARAQLSFAESATLEPDRRQAVGLAKLASLAPTWRSTHLGQSLIDAVGAIEDVADATEKAAKMPRKVILITDLQQGSHVEALGDFEWPSDVELELKRISDTRANAGLQWLKASTEGEAADAQAPLVRVSNDAGSKRETFALNWLDAKGAPAGKPTEAYVPPGESRVVRVPRLANAPNTPALRLDGDGEGFDNTLWLAASSKDEATVAYIGPDAPEDSGGLLYYLQRVFLPTPNRTVKVTPIEPKSPVVFDPAKPPALVIMTSAETSADNVRRLKGYAERGGTILGVVTASGKGGPLATIAGDAPWEVSESQAGRDFMLGEIGFDHPLFAAFAGAQFNDFTKIHFWKYRRIDPKGLGDVRVVARFEEGDPAVIEKAVGKGRLILFTSGWDPEDSQLARSSKFVPLMAALLDSGGSKTLDETSYLVDDAVPLPAGQAPGGGFVVHKPNGSTVRVEAGKTSFAETDQPGVYTLDLAGGKRTFAVNLDPVESRTAPLPSETLEQLGCKLANGNPKVLDREQMRQMQNAELEGRQKVWRWLIIGAIGLLIVETLLAGRLSRPQTAREEALAT